MLPNRWSELFLDPAAWPGVRGRLHDGSGQPQRLLVFRPAGVPGVEFIRPIRTRYPWIRIRLFEPVPWFHVGEYANPPGNDFGDLPALQAHWDAGGSSDDLVAQSWKPLPSRMGPQDLPCSFGFLMRDLIALYEALRSG